MKFSTSLASGGDYHDKYYVEDDDRNVLCSLQIKSIGMKIKQFCPECKIDRFYTYNLPFIPELIVPDNPILISFCNECYRYHEEKTDRETYLQMMYEEERWQKIQRDYRDRKGVKIQTGKSFWNLW